MMRLARKKTLGPSRSSPNGRVRIPFLVPRGPFSMGEDVYMDAGCAGHVTMGAPEPAPPKNNRNG